MNVVCEYDKSYLYIIVEAAKTICDKYMIPI